MTPVLRPPSHRPHPTQRAGHSEGKTASQAAPNSHGWSSGLGEALLEDVTPGRASRGRGRRRGRWLEGERVQGSHAMASWGREPGNGKDWAVRILNAGGRIQA